MNRKENASNRNENYSPGQSARLAEVHNDSESKRFDLHAFGEQTSKEERLTFSPFFTLISTGEITSHPRQIHYIFSDDDASEALTAALLQSSCEESSSPTSLINSSDSGSSDSKAVPVDGLSSRKNLELKTGETDSEMSHNSEERVIIVDLNSTGDKIESVNSLSPNWQVLNAQIEKAPTWSGTETNTGNTNGILPNMMLKIEGVAINDLSVGTVSTKKMRSAADTLTGEDEMQNLLEKFNQRMAVLRRVMGTRSSLNQRDNNMPFDHGRKDEEN